MQKISVIIPAHNAQETLTICLDAILSQKPPPDEVILVDDASSDATRLIAEQYEIKVISTKGNSGPAVARNMGAKAATGDIICFIDDDIIIQQGTLAKIMQLFERSEVDAVIGLLSPRLPYDGIASNYKNLYMNYTYMQLPSRVSVFYTSLAAIRSDAFHAVGGFDENYSEPGNEDLDLGQNLTAAGYTIMLDKSLQVIHHRHYGALSLLFTGFKRSRVIMKMLLRKGLSTRRKATSQTSTREYMLGAISAFIGLCLILIGVLLGSMYITVAGLCLWVADIVLNGKYLFFLYNQKGLGFMLLSMLILILDGIAHVTGGLAGIVDYLRGIRY